MVYIAPNGGLKGRIDGDRGDFGRGYHGSGSTKEFEGRGNFGGDKGDFGP